MQKRKRGEKIKAGELDREIGLLLAYKRKGANLRQEDVANAIDVTLQQYQSYEKAKSKISFSMLLKVFDVLKMNDNERNAFLKTITEKNKTI